MKILHTSDWHLGLSFKGIDIEEDQRYFLDQIYQIIKDENIKLVVHGGDVFDRKIAPAEAYDLYDEAVTKICLDLDTNMAIVAGNHDSPEKLSTCNRLLEKSGLYVEGILTRNLSKIEYDDTQVFLLPWITTERVQYVYPEESENIKTMEDAYRVVCNHMKELFNPNKRHILVSHAYVVGAETSISDRAAIVGAASAISSSVFDDFDYVALGHIHGPQYITDKVRYCGTPMMYSFGKEEDQTKSVTIIDTEDMSTKEIALKLLHARKTIKEKYEDIMNTTYSDEFLNAYIRVEVEDIYIGFNVQSELRSKFPNILEVAGKTFESEDSSITMTIDELEEKSKNPVEIFKNFYMDVMKEELNDDHILSLFNEAVEEYETKGEEA